MQEEKKPLLSCWNWRNFKELQEKGVQGVGQGECAAGEEAARRACAECISESRNMKQSFEKTKQLSKIQNV